MNPRYVFVSGSGRVPRKGLANRDALAEKLLQSVGRSISMVVEGSNGLNKAAA